MNGHLAFGRYRIAAVGLEVYPRQVFNPALKHGFRKLTAFHIVFAEVLALQRTVEAAEAVEGNPEAEGFLFGIEDAGKGFGTGADEFFGRYRFKSNPAFRYTLETGILRVQGKHRQKKAAGKNQQYFLFPSPNIHGNKNNRIRGYKNL